MPDRPLTAAEATTLNRMRGAFREAEAAMEDALEMVPAERSSLRIEIMNHAVALRETREKLKEALYKEAYNTTAQVEG